MKKKKKKKKKKNIKIGIEFDDYTTNNFYNNKAKFEPHSKKEKLYSRTNPPQTYRQKLRNNLYFFNTDNNDLFRTYNKSISIENLIEKYLQTGTVTRKFDGIKVNVKNGKLNCEYEGGLNGFQTITGNPFSNQKLKESKGDDDTVNESSLLKESS